MDLTLFSVGDGPLQYGDTAGTVLAGLRKIVPEDTIIDSDLIRAANRDRRLFLS